MDTKEVWVLLDEVNEMLGDDFKISFTLTPYPKLEVWERRRGDNLLIVRFKTTVWQATKFIRFVKKLQKGGKNES